MLVIINSIPPSSAGTAEDKMRLFGIYYILSPDMSEVCVRCVCVRCVHVCVCVVCMCVCVCVYVSLHLLLMSRQT